MILFYLFEYYLKAQSIKEHITNLKMYYSMIVDLTRNVIRNESSISIRSNFRRSFLTIMLIFNHVHN